LQDKHTKLLKEIADIEKQINPMRLNATSFNHHRTRYFRFNPDLCYPIDYLKTLIKTKYSPLDKTVQHHLILQIQIPIKKTTLKGTATKIKKKKIQKKKVKNAKNKLSKRAR
jgi:hypothetical protein